MTFIGTNETKAPERGGRVEKRRAVLSQDVKEKSFEALLAGSENRFQSVVKRASRTGLKPLQTSELREIADNKLRLQISAQRKAAKVAGAEKPKKKKPAKKG